jgi:hypothetical protein
VALEFCKLLHIKMMAERITNQPNQDVSA